MPEKWTEYWIKMFHILLISQTVKRFQGIVSHKQLTYL